MAILNKTELLPTHHLGDHLLINVQQRHNAQRVLISEVAGGCHQFNGALFLNELQIKPPAQKHLHTL